MPKDQSLRQCHLFHAFNKHEFESIIEAFDQKAFAKHETIVEEGSESQTLYLIESGEVEVLKSGKTAAGDPKQYVLQALFAGDYFGEMALLSGNKRSASVAACTPTVLRYLDIEKFFDLSKRPDLMNLFSKVVFNMARDLAKRLGATNELVMQAMAGHLQESTLSAAKARHLWVV